MSAEAVADAEGRPAGQPGVVKTDPILVVDSVRRAFGGLVAVDVDHVEVQRGEISALIGPNGAGKTTFFNLLTGFDEPNTGQWTFDGVPVAHTKPHRLARLGHGPHVPADEEPRPPVRDPEHAPRCHRPAR